MCVCGGGGYCVYLCVGGWVGVGTNSAAEQKHVFGHDMENVHSSHTQILIDRAGVNLINSVLAIQSHKHILIDCAGVEPDQLRTCNPGTHTCFN